MALAILLLGIPAFFFLYEEPTCFDGKKNGNEAGVDCGGACEKVCPFQAADVIIHWDNAFQVRPSSWSAVAVVENPNDAVAFNVPYSFKLLDEDGILISEVSGQTYIPAGRRFAIYESDISVGNREPVRDFFEFETESAVWMRSEAPDPSIEVLETRLSETETGARLFATLGNPQVAPIENIEAVGILYDIDGNMIASSRTFIDEIEGQGERDVVFTWPEDFSGSVTRREVLYRIFPTE